MCCSTMSELRKTTGLNSHNLLKKLDITPDTIVKGESDLSRSIFAENIAATIFTKIDPTVWVFDAASATANANETELIITEDSFPYRFKRDDQ